MAVAATALKKDPIPPFNFLGHDTNVQFQAPIKRKQGIIYHAN